MVDRMGEKLLEQDSRPLIASDPLLRGDTRLPPSGAVLDVKGKAFRLNGPGGRTSQFAFRWDRPRRSKRGRLTAAERAAAEAAERAEAEAAAAAEGMGEMPDDGEARPAASPETSFKGALGGEPSLLAG